MPESLPSPVPSDAESARFRILEPLRAAQEQLARVQDAAGIGVFTLDLREGVLHPSPAFCRLHGLEVRERYALSHWEALSDLFPLCELTPASRLLFLPFDPSRFLAEYPGHARHRFSAQEVRALNAYGKKMNVRFRAFYNALFPALYGSAWGI